MNKEEAKKLIISTINSGIVIKRLDGDETLLDATKALKKIKILSAIDQIEPDHPKVKLPREVGEDLEDWLKADSIDNIITDIVWLTDDHMAVRDWWESTLDATYLIADMARYGWEAEPEERFYVQAPKNWQSDEEFPIYIQHGINFMSTTGNIGIATPFTRAELKQYQLDSDIFTMVPVGEEK